MQPVQDRTDVSVGEYFDVLKRRWLWIIVTMLIFTGFSLFNDVRAQPVYQSSTQMLLKQDSASVANALNNSTNPITPDRAIQNELKIINSATVRAAAAKAYGRPITVRAVSGGDADVILLTATGRTGVEAARKANVYATAYQQSRLDAVVASLAQAKLIIQKQINDFQAAIDKIDLPLKSLDAQILNTPSSDPRYASLIATEQRIKQSTDAQRTVAQNALADYEQRLQVLNLSERLNQTGTSEVLNPAGVPSSPVSPTIVRNAIQALIVGLFVGIGLAFLRDQLDDSLRTKADLERAVRDLPTIGMVPLDPGWRDARSPRMATVAAPMSAAAESYRGLRTAIQYAGIDRPMTLIQVTSASAGEGKTTLLANLAVAFAQAGKKVAVVGCDLRKPRMHQFMDVDGSVGFTSVVLGDVTLQDALQQSPLHPNIDVLASGPRPPNPSELLSLDRAANILRTLAQDYTVVFIDCPPVLPVTDALVLSRCVDATIFLATANKTTRRTARRSVELLRQVNSPLVGTVLNGVAAEDTYGSLYEYYGYVRRSRVPVIGRFLDRRSVDVPSTSEDILPQEPGLTGDAGDMDAP